VCEQLDVPTTCVIQAPPLTHIRTLPAAGIPPCMFSWPVKSPSSQVSTHLLNLRRHANLNHRGNLLSNDEFICMQRVAFRAPWGMLQKCMCVHLPCDAKQLSADARCSLALCKEKLCTSFQLNVLLFSCTAVGVFFYGNRFKLRTGVNLLCPVCSRNISLCAGLFVY